MKIKHTVLAFLCVVMFLCAHSVSAQGRQSTDAARSARLLLIPLDDRPPCVQFPIMIGRTGDAEVVTPPREMLGRFTVPGDTEKIAEWVRAQDLRSFDAVIVAVDMVAYGGLVNSRVHRTPLNEALARLDLLRWMRRTAPRLPVYGFNVIMRLAPTGDGRNEAYREKLARWAEISPDTAKDATLAAEVARLEKEIPAAALSDYKAARQRNFTINRSSIEMVKSGVLDYLILLQDDARPHGVHVADRERLIAEANRLTLQDRVDDYAYHSLIRPEARKLAASNNLNPNGLQGEGEERVENFIRERLRPEVDRLWRDFANHPFSIGPKQQSVATLLPTALNDFRLDLPWGRTFEAEITFDVVAALAKAK